MALLPSIVVEDTMTDHQRRILHKSSISFLLIANCFLSFQANLLACLISNATLICDSLRLEFVVPILS
ncbi:MAG: hypothetical protein R3264_21400, partial [Anaerolineae bacterium]|nr:hypothetical protein [Anaerolineae bacterium]